MCWPRIIPLGGPFLNLVLGLSQKILVPIILTPKHLTLCDWPRARADPSLGFASSTCLAKLNSDHPIYIAWSWSPLASQPPASQFKDNFVQWSDQMGKAPFVIFHIAGKSLWLLGAARSEQIWPEGSGEPRRKEITIKSSCLGKNHHQNLLLTKTALQLTPVKGVKGDPPKQIVL